MGEAGISCPRCEIFGIVSLYNEGKYKQNVEMWKWEMREVEFKLTISSQLPSINDTINVKQKSRWALLKTRFRNSLSSPNENREKKLFGSSANGQRPERK